MDRMETRVDETVDTPSVGFTHTLWALRALEPITAVIPADQVDDSTLVIEYLPSTQPMALTDGGIAAGIAVVGGFITGLLAGKRTAKKIEEIAKDIRRIGDRLEEIAKGLAAIIDKIEQNEVWIAERNLLASVENYTELAPLIVDRSADGNEKKRAEDILSDIRRYRGQLMKQTHTCYNTVALGCWAEVDLLRALGDSVPYRRNVAKTYQAHFQDARQRYAAEAAAAQARRQDLEARAPTYNDTVLDLGYTLIHSGLPGGMQGIATRYDVIGRITGSFQSGYSGRREVLPGRSVREYPMPPGNRGYVVVREADGTTKRYGLSGKWQGRYDERFNRQLSALQELHVQGTRLEAIAVPMRAAADASAQLEEKAGRIPEASV